MDSEREHRDDRVQAAASICDEERGLRRQNLIACLRYRDVRHLQGADRDRSHEELELEEGS